MCQALFSPPSKGRQTFPVKGHTVLQATQSVSQLLGSASVLWKQPWTVNKLAWLGLVQVGPVWSTDATCQLLQWDRWCTASTVDMKSEASKDWEGWSGLVPPWQECPQKQAWVHLEEPCGIQANWATWHSAQVNSMHLAPSRYPSHYD